MHGLKYYKVNEQFERYANGVDGVKIVIDPGHGGVDVGALGTYSREKDINLILSLKLKKQLVTRGIDIIMTREDDRYVYLQDRSDIANQNQADYFISIHCNSSSNAQISGTETFCYSENSEGYILAKILQTKMIEYNKNNDRGVKTANFYVLRMTEMPAVLIETMFITNAEEEETLNEPNWQDMFVNQLSEAIGEYLNFPSTSKDKTPIIGDSQATDSQMEQYVRNVNPEAPYVAALYLKYGEIEGVKGDMAFAQAIHETGYFKFQGNININQNNFGGLGATGTGTSGASFDTAEKGVLAHIQHLKAYATTAPLNTDLEDPRFHLVQRGIAPNWEDLDGRWAVPGFGYGKTIVELWQEILQIDTDTIPNHYAQDAYEQWRAKSIILEEHDLEKPVKWGEYIITQERLREI